MEERGKNIERKGRGRRKMEEGFVCLVGWFLNVLVNY